MNWTITPPASTVIWTGAIGTDWNTAGNWNPNTAVPGATSNVTVPAGPSNMPNIATGASGSVATLTIQNNASLTLAGTASLTVSGTFNNSGTVYLSTTATAPASPGSGTFVYNGTGGTILNMGYYNLTVDSVGQTFTLGNALTVNGNLVVNSGTLNAAGQNVTVSGGLTVNSAGVFTAGNNVSVSGSVSGAGVDQRPRFRSDRWWLFHPGHLLRQHRDDNGGGPMGAGSVHAQQRHRDPDGDRTVAASNFYNLNENGADPQAEISPWRTTSPLPVPFPWGATTFQSAAL